MYGLATKPSVLPWTKDPPQQPSIIAAEILRAVSIRPLLKVHYTSEMLVSL
jgi:hypothetical protein